jgi:hypothetical protein
MSLPSNGNAGRRIETFKLDGDLRDAYVELLSAQCAVERLKMRYSANEMASSGSKFMVARSISAAGVICEYFSSVQKSLQPQAGPYPGLENGQKELFFDESK